MTQADVSIRRAGDVWKLVEYEKHFNIIQAGIRALASAWLLAAFGSIGFVLKRSADESLVTPERWLVVVICFMGAFGILLLWVIDQRVYHSLLSAVFVVALRAEHAHSCVPPVHTMMMASSPKGSLRKRLKYFYAGPVAALGITAFAMTTYYAARLDSSPMKSEVAALYGLVALTLILPLVLMYRRDPDLGMNAMGALFESKDFNSMLAVDDYTRVLRRYTAPRRQKPEYLAVENSPSNRAMDGSTVTPLIRFPAR